MNASEQRVWDTLLELERTAALARTAQPRPSILPILEKLDQLTAQLPSDTPAELRHYLQHKSYEKARLFLAGRGAENTPGTCA